MSIKNFDKTNFDKNNANLLKAVKDFIELNANKVYTHNQNILSKQWLINHNLGYIPSIDIVDSSGTTWLADITHVDVNNAIINFGHDMIGKAVCK